MKTHTAPTYSLALLLLLPLLLGSGCPQPTSLAVVSEPAAEEVPTPAPVEAAVAQPEDGPDGTTAEELSQTEAATQWLKGLYESAKATGEKVPADVYQWAKGDVLKIGAWDYHIAAFADETPEEVLAELKRLGEERWECFWVENSAAGKVFYFKKAQRSTIKTMGGVSTFLPISAGSAN